MIELVKAVKNAVEVTPSYLHSHIEFLGVTFHVTILRVMYKDDILVPYNQECENDAELFYHMQCFLEGRYHTIQVPGREGDWAMFIYPYCM